MTRSVFLKYGSARVFLSPLIRAALSCREEGKQDAPVCYFLSACTPVSISSTSLFIHHVASKEKRAVFWKRHVSGRLGEKKASLSLLGGGSHRKIRL